MKPALVKGTRDFAPEVMRRRDFIFDTLKRVFTRYGYQPLETPVLERLDTLLGKYGDEGDRLIFRVMKRGNSLEKAIKAGASEANLAAEGLRYDLTVPFARFVAMNQHALSFPFKRYQIQPVWRADRPQRGRYREFYQCDVDVVGTDSLMVEAEYLAIFDEGMSRLGLRDFTIRLSNRKILNGFAEVVGRADRFTEICVALDKLDKIGTEGVENELTERGLTTNEVHKLLAMATYEDDNAGRLAFLAAQFADCEVGQRGVAELRAVLAFHREFERHAAKISIDPSLARGLTYYTGCIFEVETHEVKMGSIASGGRYDDLTGVFGLKDVSGCGISFGAARIYDVLDSLDRFPDSLRTGTRVLAINFGDAAEKAALRATNRLREAGVAAECFPEAAKLKKQFSYADRNNIPYTLIIGEEELEKGMYQLKDMASGEQVSVDFEALKDRLVK